jgi:phosphoribosylanthranilate isomerase
MVKICGITRRQDAEAALAAGASAIGFVFARSSPRYVAPETAAELGRGLDVWKVGVFVDETPAAVEAIMRASYLDIAQIYGGELPDVPRVWRALRPRAEVRPAERVEAILLDGPSNGITFDWSLARTSAGKIIVAGGLNAANVAEAIRIVHPWGVDASSSLESAPGIKDPEKIRQFINAARSAAKEAA